RVKQSTLGLVHNRSFAKAMPRDLFFIYQLLKNTHLVKSQKLGTTQQAMPRLKASAKFTHAMLHCEIFFNRSNAYH
ncbi:MAG TPA: hypothetical protein PK002_12665, partial [Cellvibrio sp.]|nr:hypothetical protein [Cellvibrio sp.]